jgi:HPt (histidine-containing phosphotransfer) domain-containing protein
MSEMEEQRTHKVVRVDPDLMELIPAYLANRVKDIASLRAALASGDYATVSRLAHQLRGSGGGYGLHAVTAFGVQLWDAAHAADAVALARTTDELERYLNTVEIMPSEAP